MNDENKRGNILSAVDVINDYSYVTLTKMRNGEEAKNCALGNFHSQKKNKWKKDEWRQATDMKNIMNEKQKSMNERT